MASVKGGTVFHRLRPAVTGLLGQTDHCGELTSTQLLDRDLAAWCLELACCRPPACVTDCAVSVLEETQVYVVVPGIALYAISAVFQQSLLVSCVGLQLASTPWPAASLRTAPSFAAKAQ